MFFKLIGIIVRFLPALIAAIHMVEGLTAPNTLGEDKKELVLVTIRKILVAAGVALSDSVNAALSQAIDVVVAIFNLLGVFNHAEDETAPETDGTGVVSAAAVAQVTEVIRSYPNDARFDELEAALRASR